MGDSSYNINAYRSWRRLAGNFEPGGKRGFSPEVSRVCPIASFADLELPAFPDLTIPLRGGMRFSPIK